jgi:SAM-dependent MidA family methyltransferase
MNPLERVVAAEIERRGSLPFSEVMELALYDPEYGFYATGGGAGRRRDFLTSPEVGPLFGAVVARALDEWWREMGSPDRFVVVEAGAGVGTLARSVLDAAPACSAALRYVLVERSAALRGEQTAHLALEDPSLAFPPAAVDDDDEVVTSTVPGPIVVSLAELPKITGAAVVIANELLDNFPVDLADVGLEVRVTSIDGRLAFDGTPRAPVQKAAARWVSDARAVGRVIVFDYADTTESMRRRSWTEWLRTYRAHGRGTSPVDSLGEQDITCEVAVDQLPTPTSNLSQAEWLRVHGIEDLVEEGRARWEERKATGDLEALKARSRIGESEALTDPTGLGAFRVLEWLP